MFSKVAGIALVVLGVGVIAGAVVQIVAESVRGLSTSGWDSLSVFLVAWAVGTVLAFWILRKL